MRAFLTAALVLFFSQSTFADIVAGSWLWVPAPASTPATVKFYNSQRELLRTDTKPRQEPVTRSLFEVGTDWAAEFSEADGSCSKYEVVVIDNKRYLIRTEGDILFMVVTADDFFKRGTLKCRVCTRSFKIPTKGGGYVIISVPGELRFLDD
jgi:hypothetical protein